MYEYSSLFSKKEASIVEDTLKKLFTINTSSLISIVHEAYLSSTD